MVESVLSGQVLLHRHKRLAFEYVPLVAPHSLSDDRLRDIRPRKNYGHECLAFLEKTVCRERPPAQPRNKK